MKWKNLELYTCNQVKQLQILTCEHNSSNSFMGEVLDHSQLRFQYRQTQKVGVAKIHHLSCNSSFKTLNSIASNKRWKAERSKLLQTRTLSARLVRLQLITWNSLQQQHFNESVEINLWWFNKFRTAKQIDQSPTWTHK